MPKITDAKGHQIDFDAAVYLMDEELMETLHFQDYGTEQAFFDAYVTAHREKFGEDFAVN